MPQEEIEKIFSICILYNMYSFFLMRMNRGKTFCISYISFYAIASPYAM